MALDAPLAALERHCGLARGHGRFFLNAGAFIGLMVVSNALEEELYTNLPGFDYFKAVACLELATFAAAALYSERRSGLKTPRKAPLAFYAVLGASMALSQTLGKLANKYVNFTVSTIFKCSKALPTMALMVLCGKRYTLANVAAALTMALSAFCFAVGARQADADFNFLGVLLNGLYLLFQAVHKSNYLHAIDATPARWRGGRARRTGRLCTGFRLCRSRCRTARCATTARRSTRRCSTRTLLV